MHSKKVSFDKFFTDLNRFDLLELFRTIGYRLMSENTDINSIINIAEKAHDFLYDTNSYIIITNMEALQFIYVSTSVRQVTGYTIEEFLKGNIPMFIKSYCAADRLNGNFILDKITSHQKQHNVLDKNKYQYVTTFRYLNKKGYYNWMYNRMFFVKHDEKNKPEIAMSIVTNIDFLKKDDKIIFSRLKFEQKTGKYNIEFKEEFQPQYINLLKSTDLKILQYLIKGLNNKQIAAELNLSECTIKDYRKKMLNKTWCDNTSELICFALRNKLFELGI